MSVLSPPLSTRSFHSPRSSVYTALDSRQQAPSTSTVISTAYAQSPPFSKLPHDGTNISPDELFTKYTVSEVRTVQQRLKADADAKQEELRLMVGERYRDLLQASSSIISIAKSSQNVLNALIESKDAIISQHVSPLPPQLTSFNGVDDRHLSALQVLSAHVKLLLDAPEHLWRLIERRNYLQAAWLFLLSRVVHRALVRQDDGEEQPWFGEGIDVLAEFPLVQRQWEVVSQFRAQIIHKSTLSLREANASSWNTCATLVTLHLLDSRPLTETLSTLLSQRTRTLHMVIPSINGEAIKKTSSFANGISNPSGESLSVREVRQNMKKAFAAISQTVVTARIIFLDEVSKPALIFRVLRTMQIENSDSQSALSQLPDELRVTAQSLLTQLTSSANVQLLPNSLRSYKPYVDLDSSSSQLTSAELSRQLHEWFATSCNRWKGSTVFWLRNLQTLKEVWTLRNSMHRCMASSGLGTDEIHSLSVQIDSLYRDRILTIWHNVLSDTEAKFAKSLAETVSLTKDSLPVQEDSLADFLFQITPVPILPTTVKSFGDTPFQKYQLSLKRQLVGRSPLLDNVLAAVEQCARVMQQDFLHMKINVDDITKSLIDDLLQSYQHAADALTVKIFEVLNRSSEEVIARENFHSLVFLSRIADTLMSSSPFIDNLGCTQSAGRDFRHKMSTMNDVLIRKWCELTVRDLPKACGSKMQNASNATDVSSSLLQGLLNLCDKMRYLGVMHHSTQQDDAMREILRSFIILWLDDFKNGNVPRNLHDVMLLQSISTKYGDSWNDISAVITEVLQSTASDEAAIDEAKQSVSEYLARTQTLFAALLPPPSVSTFDAPLARFGTPVTGQMQQAAIDLAKPSPRFGMLLVGTVASDR